MNLSHTSEKVKDKAQEASSDIAETFKEQLGKVKKNLNQSGEAIKEKMSDWEESLTNYVKENPGKTVVFSMIAGMLLSRFLHK